MCVSILRRLWFSLIGGKPRTVSLGQCRDNAVFVERGLIAPKQTIFNVSIADTLMPLARTDLLVSDCTHRQT